jgi:thiol:disulfide interchange protein DsbD
VALAAAAVLHALPVVQGLRLRRGLALAALAVALFLAVRALESGLGIRLLPRRSAAVQEAWRRDWLEQDYEGALARARAERKVVVIDVWAEWCAQCKELDEKTWPDPRIGAWLQQHAVPVRIDTDRVRKDLVRPLGIVGYPTVLVLDGEGRILRRQEGFQDREAMLAFLEGR